MLSHLQAKISALVNRSWPRFRPLVGAPPIAHFGRMGSVPPGFAPPPGLLPLS
jgi:hypothetical protein